MSGPTQLLTVAQALLPVRIARSGGATLEICPGWDTRIRLDSAFPDAIIRAYCHPDLLSFRHVKSRVHICQKEKTMADEKEKAIEKGEELKPRAPEALPDELAEEDIDKVSGGLGIRGPYRDQY